MYRCGGKTLFGNENRFYFNRWHLQGNSRPGIVCNTDYRAFSLIAWWSRIKSELRQNPRLFPRILVHDILQACLMWLPSARPRATVFLG